MKEIKGVVLLDLDRPFIYRFKREEINKNIIETDGEFTITKASFSMDEFKHRRDSIPFWVRYGKVFNLRWSGSLLICDVEIRSALRYASIKRMLEKGLFPLRMQGTVNDKSDGPDVEGLFIHSFYVLPRWDRDVTNP